MQLSFDAPTVMIDRHHRLSLLGGFGVDCDGQSLTLPRNAQRLVAYLALRGRRPRTEIAGTLWPQVSEERAQGSLRTSMWRLLSGFGQLVVVNGTELSLASTVAVDVDELTRYALSLIRAESCDLPDAGIGPLTCSDLLPGWYDDWVLFEREQLRQLRLHALEAAAERLLDLDRTAEALAIALEAIRAEPLRESAHRLALAVHLAEGNQFEALRHYESLRQLLRTELGVEPSERTARMIQLRLPPDRPHEVLEPAAHQPQHRIQ